jgi:excinuclease UvrABC nuclease subunit
MATPLVKEEKHSQALQVIEAGIDAIRDFLDEYQQSQRAEECAELTNLEQWREEVLQVIRRSRAATPEDLAEDLRQQLQAAVASENFEEAARLRDEIRRLATEQPNV